MIRCQQCGAYHDVFEIQPRFGFPEAYLEVPANERERYTRSGSDWCVLRDDTSRDRYFLRATLPFVVHGEPRPYSWGIWVEVDKAGYDRASELWDLTPDASEPPIPAVVANRLPAYPETMGLPGFLHLAPAGVAPNFVLDPSVDHPLANEQRAGVHPERALEWASPFLHQDHD
jgi:hypothetical protein